MANQSNLWLRKILKEQKIINDASDYIDLMHNPEGKRFLQWLEKEKPYINFLEKWNSEPKWKKWKKNSENDKVKIYEIPEDVIKLAAKWDDLDKEPKLHWTLKAYKRSWKRVENKRKRK